MKHIPVKSGIVETGVKKNETHKKANAESKLTVNEIFPPIETAEDIEIIEKELFDVFDDYRRNS